MINFPRMLAVVFAVALTGCAATGSRYYSLQSLPVVPATTSAVQTFADAINVQSVVIPEQVDRPQLVLTGKEGTQVSVMNGALWVSPLDGEIRLAVANRLSQQLGVPDLNGSSVPEGLTRWSIALTIHRFDAVYGEKVVVQASWRLASQPAGAHKELPVICSATAERPASGDIDSVVKAYQAAMTLISDQIAAQISAARLGQNPVSGAKPDGAVVSQGLTLQGCTSAVANLKHKD